MMKTSSFETPPTTFNQEAKTKIVEISLNKFNI